MHPASARALVPLVLLACTAPEPPADGAAAVEDPVPVEVGPVAGATPGPEPSDAAAEGSTPAQEDPEGEPDGDELTQERLEALAEEMRRAVEELRGAEFRRPVPSEVTGAEGFRAYMQARIEAEATPEDLHAEETVAKLLGLLPPDMDYVGTMMELVESQVGGFYDPTTEGFYIMPGFGDALVKTVLVHELTHALDDQIYDLDAGLFARKGNGDAQWAYHAVVEGSGTLVMNIWSMRHLTGGGLDLGDVQEIMDRSLAGLKDAPAFLWKPLMGAYTRGEKFLGEPRKELELPERIARAFGDPPRSSEQVLHPEKYWSPEEADEPAPVAFRGGFLPEGWTVLDEDTAGEILLALVTEPLEDRKPVTSLLQLMATRYTNKAARGWGGDRYVLLGRGDDRLLHLASVWDTEEDAAEFEQALAGLAAHLEEAAQGYDGTLPPREGIDSAPAVTLLREGDRVFLTIAVGTEPALIEAAPTWALFPEPEPKPADGAR